MDHEIHPRTNGLGGDAPPPSHSDDDLQQQWRAYQQSRANTKSVSDPFLLHLPSGMKVKARRPHLLLLLRTGRIPDSLTPRVHDLIAVAQNGGDEAVSANLKQEQATDPASFYSNWMNLLDIVWMESVVSPTFTATPQTDLGALALSGVSEDDKTFLFVWAQGVDQTIADFLDGKARAGADVGSPSVGDGVRARPGDAPGN